jgi:hypothetical protein
VPAWYIYNCTREKKRAKKKKEKRKMRVYLFIISLSFGIYLPFRCCEAPKREVKKMGSEKKREKGHGF